MKQHEAVINVMEEIGGLATLAQLYQSVNVSSWKTKTPFASIRRIVQDERFFFKIKPGLWALNSYKEKLSHLIPIDKSKSKEEKDVYNHSYYQGLLVEIGNLKGFHTFIPNQDKNKKFLTSTLGDFATLKDIYKFTYEDVVSRAKTIDVIWFNNRKFPESFFEVEHSTDFQNSFLKMLDLKHFYANFNIVADIKRFREFEKKISYSTFDELKNRIKFISYEKLSDYHSKSFLYFALNKELQI
ncbi:MAG: hypothetical protein A2068_01340 [Ignavibacteria bacterium GWB2_35_6b]|nr:MAG: hypothetical protein A2068_01340 [Ignavibacteria bacterium GWB2_35_6b]